MPYAFEPADTSVADAFARIAAEQLDAAIAGAARPETVDKAGLHDLRKRIKKLRGLMRLFRPVLSGFGTENAALRDAARAIAHLRDAQVRLGTFEGLRAGLPDDPALTALHARLQDEAAEAAAHRNDAAIAAYGAALAGVRDRLPGLKLRAKGFAALRPGLERTLAEARRGRKAAAAALADPAFPAEPLHAWRTRAKQHWYQARLLAPIWPAMMAPHVQAADDLGELLGDHNDIDVLLHHLADAPPAALALLEPVALARRRALAGQAVALGRRLFADRPEALADRWAVWWRAWRKDAAT